MAAAPKPKLDWDQIHRRLDAIQQVIDHGWSQSPESKANVLRSRAQALARKPAGKDSAEDFLEVVEFLLAYENYGIELKYVREVYPLKDFTPLPGTPAFIMGVTNVRGQVLSIIDLKKLFDLPDRGLTDFNKIIIVQSGGMEIGLLADSVLGLESIPLKEIQSTLPTLTGVREDFLKGVTRGSMVILDAQKLLAVRQAEW